MTNNESDKPQKESDSSKKQKPEGQASSDDRVHEIEEMLHSGGGEEVVLEEKDLGYRLAQSVKELFKSSPQDDSEEADGGGKNFEIPAGLGAQWRALVSRLKPGSAKKAAESDGSAAPKIRPKILVYTALGVAVIVAGWFASNFLLDGGGGYDDDPSTITFDDKSKSKAARAKAKKKRPGSKSIEPLPKAAIESALVGCTIPAVTRDALLASPVKENGQKIENYNLAVSTIGSFQKRIDDSGLMTQLNRLDEKNGIIDRLLRPSIQSIRNQVERYRGTRKEKSRRLEELRIKEQGALDGKKLQSRVVSRVNEGIKIRNEIADLETFIGEGPGERELTALEAMLQTMEAALHQRTAEKPASDDAVEPRISALAALPVESLETELQESIARTLNPLTTSDQAETALKKFQVQNATRLLAEMTTLLEFLRSRPGILFSQLDEEQSEINGKLRQLLGKDDRYRVNYTLCLEGKTAALPSF